ncbi:helix-turn-helix domain-containing protein [Levilactobacillus huananensis]|uniref:helix-turn-helix domain-containing protein n=1 Tax=Levilactobacillus huananensis TaxID=2486019 RepID=UPI000F76BE8F|nr:helix-turn-helix domain-containing protein [Levilactobacillus huananensis]
MTKYSTQFKVKVVREYFSGGIGLKDLSIKYQIPSRENILNWVKQAQAHGISTLKVKHHRQTYSPDYKLKVVDYIQTNEVSRRQAAVHFGISTSQTNNWMTIYQKQGVAGLRRKPRGRRPIMSKHKSQGSTAKRLTPTKEEKYKQQITELRRQLHEAELDRDILKTLATITKKQPR